MSETLTPQEMVREFHKTYMVPISDKVELIGIQRVSLRYELIREELEELNYAMNTNNLVEIADALGDIIYVTYGAALEYGIDLDKVIKAIHESNMSKLDTSGKPIIREDGKILKGPNYFKPRIKEILL